MMTMEEHASDAEDIVAGILADADAEVARILAEAAAYAAQSAARAADQAATIAREAAAKAEAQAAVLQADTLAKATIESRKRSLRLQESLSGVIVERAAATIAALAARSGYRDILRLWIAEALVGLSAEAATVNASMAELPLIDEELLRAAEAEALAATGKATRLRRVEGDPVIGQGVYLLAEGGRLAYDNRVATRFERNKADIRKLIYEALNDKVPRA
jgi:vacuolar-type H+-ATPase subunit E/Vma4